MKKWLVLLAVLGLLLAGCGARETFETVGDVYVQAQTPKMQQVVLDLSRSAAVAVMQSEDGGTLYFCDGYTVTVQTMASGDLNRTLLETTGFPRDSLRPLETSVGEAKRYDCVWTAAGEGEEQVGRAAVIDDGNYHYVVTVMADASDAKDLAGEWQRLLDSVRILPEGMQVNTGS